MPVTWGSKNLKLYLGHLPLWLSEAIKLKPLHLSSGIHAENKIYYYFCLSARRERSRTWLKLCRILRNNFWLLKTQEPKTTGIGVLSWELQPITYMYIWRDSRTQGRSCWRCNGHEQVGLITTLCSYKRKECSIFS